MKKKLTTMILVLGAAIGLAAAQSIATHEKVQLWEGGPYWATTNIGAEKPEDYGYYFWWGDTVGYRRQGNAWVATDGSSSNFRFWDSSKSMQTYNKSISTLQSDGWVVLKDGAYVLASEHDAAQVQWGGGWRMPTDQEMDDLCHNKCDWTWTTQNGVNGYIVSGRGDYAAASIFLPCAGYGEEGALSDAGSDGKYWSAVPSSGYDYAYVLYFGGGYFRTSGTYRPYGQSIRPVQGFGTSTPESTPTPTPPTPEPEKPCYEVLNAKDITAPYAAPKAATLQGVAYDGCDVAGIVELKLGKVSKGKSKVSGSFTGLDGKKISIKAVTVGDIDGSKPATVSLEVKSHGTMTVTIGGDKFAGSLGGWHVQSGTVGGNWTKGMATVGVDASDVSMFAGTVLSKLLPNGEQAKANGGKWSFAKAASVKWAKPKKGAEQPEVFDPESGKGLIVDTSKGGNLSGMKLSYTPKKGTFKGTFKVYALEGAGKATKLKKYTVKVSGVVVDGVGHGVATSKNPAVSWAVTVK